MHEHGFYYGLVREEEDWHGVPNNEAREAEYPATSGASERCEVLHRCPHRVRLALVREVSLIPSSDADLPVKAATVVHQFYSN